MTVSCMTRLLPDLRSNDKAVIVITHDDKYFHLADRVNKLDCGQVEMEDGHESIGAALQR